MGYEEVVTILVIIIALVLFATEYVRLDVVAIGIMVVLSASGVLTVGQAVKGFSNSATLTVAAMFVLSEAIIQTGVIQKLSDYLSKLFARSYAVSVGIMSGLVGSVSAFINNTPVVATFIPIVSSAAKDIKKSPASYLIPLSYGAIFGGACTLIGTSTNLLVSGILGDAGHQEFSMFTLAPLGLVFFVAGTIYMMFLMERLIPIRTKDLEEYREKEISDYLIEVLVDKVDQEHGNLGTYCSDCEVLFHKRDGEVEEDPSDDKKLEHDDRLLIKGSLSNIKDLLKSDIFRIGRTEDRQFTEEATELVEIVIVPNSTLSDKKLKNVNFLEQFQAVLLAIRQRGKENFEKLDNLRLQPGDVLLLRATPYGAEQLNQYDDAQRSSFLPMRRQSLEKLDKNKLILVISTLTAVIGIATFTSISILISAFAGIVFLAVTKVITMQEAYKAIDWKVIFLLAGALSLGAAMTASGITENISIFLKEYVSQKYGPVVIIATLYFIAALLTEIISNNATAALLTPVAINLADAMDADVLPFALTIAYACSSSFLTPVSYQTNTMVYSAGSYKYADFLKTGFPLKIIFWILATVLIPLFYSVGS